MRVRRPPAGGFAAPGLQAHPICDNAPMPEDHFGEPVAERYDESAADMFDPAIVDPAVDFLAALAGRGAALELGIGTGRIAIPTAAAGLRVIGIDSSPGMLEVCQERAELAGVADRLDLRLGELEVPPVEERVALVTCPFRSYLHLLDDESRLRSLRAV